MIKNILNIKNSKKDIRKFGITFGIIFCIIAGILFWNKNFLFQNFILYGVSILVVSTTVPFILKPIYWVWMVIANMLGWFMTHLILVILFYTIITPIGVLSRLFGKNFLDLNWKTKESTYWNNRNSILDTNYEKQY